MSLIIQKNGILTTVQDLGRIGFRRLGINPNGAMDRHVVRLINILLGNTENEAVLEMHFPAPELEFSENAVIALGGADFGARSAGIALENWRPHLVRKGHALKFSRKRYGSRAYLSVKGGFEIKNWLESSSTNLQAGIGGFEGRTLKKGDRLFFRTKTQKIPGTAKISRKLAPMYPDKPTIRIIAGAEFEDLTGLSGEVFLTEEFTISANSNRMGFRLMGKPLYLLDKADLVSSAVDFGTIQLLPDGQMIILMADHQTTGGYPRIGHLVSVDLPVLAQLGPNDSLKFQLVTIEEAEDLALKFERDLKFLKTGIGLHDF